MTNVVYEDGGSYLVPSLAEQMLTEDGAEWISWPMANRLKFYLHTLDTTEVSELNSMGITHVRLLDSSAADKRVQLAAGVVVMMIGAGYDGASWQTECTIADNFDTWEDDMVGNVQADPAERTALGTGIPNDYEPGIAYPDMLYRIVFAVGPDCQLVRDGTLDAAPHSPDAMSRSTHYRFDQYLVVLPRLQSTVDLLNTAPVKGTMPGVVTVLRAVDGVQDQKSFTVCDTIGESVQSPEQFKILSPEGVDLDDNEEILWGVSAVTNN